MASFITNSDQKKYLLLDMAAKEEKEIYQSLSSLNVEENFDTIIGRLDEYLVPQNSSSYEHLCPKRLSSYQQRILPVTLQNEGLLQILVSILKWKAKLEITLLLIIVLKNFKKLCFVNKT